MNVRWASRLLRTAKHVKVTTHTHTHKQVHTYTLAHTLTTLCVIHQTSTSATSKTSACSDRARTCPECSVACATTDTSWTAAEETAQVRTHTCHHVYDFIKHIKITFSTPELNLRNPVQSIAFLSFVSRLSYVYLQNCIVINEQFYVFKPQTIIELFLNNVSFSSRFHYRVL